MSPFKRNMTRVVIFTSIVLFTAAITSGIYYMKIKKNEDIQNQLQFRELRLASTGINMSLEKLKRIAKYFRENLSCDMIDLVSVPNEFLLESTCSPVIAERIQQINQSMDLRHIKLESVQEYSELDQPSFNAATEITIDTNGLTYINTYLPLKIDEMAKFSHAKVQLSVPTKDLIPNRLDLFSLVMLSDENGKLLGRRDYEERQISALDVRFSSLEEYIILGQNNVSQIKDVQIAGLEYRLYVQPLEGSEIWAQQQNKLIVGLIPLSTINVNKLMISPVVITWVVLVLLLLVAFTPLLKLRFINSKYAFTSSDVSQLVLGLVLCTGLLSICANQQMFYQYFMDSKINQGKIILDNIQKDFLAEVNTLVKFVENDKYKDNKKGIKKIRAKDYINVLNPTLVFDPNLVFNPKKSVEPKATTKTTVGDFFIIEILAQLGDDGTFPDGSEVHYIKEDLFINAKIPLKEREYFKQTLACNTWRFAHHKKPDPKIKNWCLPSLYIQRINNIEDGRKNSMFAMPLQAQENDAEKKVIIFNTRLKSLTNLVLPLDFGFAVFDNKGDVLYHSDDEASLIENIFVETGQNEQFITAVKQHTDDKSPIPLSLKYGGKNHLFISAPLASKQNQQSLPWNIVVFYDEGAMAMNSMLLVFLAVLTFFSIIVPMFFLLRYLTKQHFWIKTLYFNENKTSRYKAWTILIASLSVCCLALMGIVDDLISRIVMWLLFCLIAIMFLFRVHKVDMTGFRRIHYPTTPIIAIILFLIMIGLGMNSLDWSLSRINYIAAVMGLAILLFNARSILPDLKNDSAPTKFSDVGTLGNNGDCKIRPREFADEQRFTSSYIAYLLSLVFLAGAVPSILITNSTHGYLLQRQAEMQSVVINESKSNFVTANTQYIDFLQQSSNPKLLQSRIAWGKLTDWKKIFSSAHLCQVVDNDTSWITIEGLGPTDTEECDTKDANKRKQNYSDDTLDLIFASLSVQDSLGTQLTYLALKDKEQRANGQRDNSQEFSLLFRPDKYMLAASFATVANIVVGMLLILLVLYKALQYLVVTRLMGEHVPEHFRVVKPCDAYSSIENRWPLLRHLARKLKIMHEETQYSDSQQSLGGTHILLLNANANSAVKLCHSLGISLYEDKTLDISDLLDLNANVFVFEDGLRHQFSLHPLRIITIAISGLDEISHEESTRKLAARALSRLVTMKQLNIILVADTAPGYRLLRNEAYNLGHETKNHSKIDIDEKLSWSKLLTFFDKEYAWAPKQKRSMSNSLNITRTIEYESDGWYELEAVKDKFYEYHTRIKSPTSCQHDVQNYWLPEQIVEFFMIQAGPLYRKHWELCTVDEKVALWQLAQGSKVNPANAEVIQHLTRRGFIYRDKGWHIINESFRRFILTAESASVIDLWMDSTRSGLWPIIRIPLFTLLFVLIVVVIYSSGFALNSVLGVATTTLGIIPLLLKNLSLIRFSSSSISD